MQLLFLTSRLPFPPLRGDRLRTFQLLRLFALEHTVTLVSFIGQENERHLAEQLRAYCDDIHLLKLPKWKSAANVALNLWQDEPFQTLYYQTRQMERMVENLLSTQAFDAAYVHLFRMAPYLKNHSEIYRILDLTDLISYELRSSLPYQPLPWRIIYRFEEPRISRYEQQIASYYDEVWFINKRDRDLFAEGGQQAQVQVIPNSIDEALFRVDQTASDTPRLLFVGNLDVRHNVDALRFMAEEIMPLILRDVPECELQIVGAGNRRKIIGLEKLPGVQVVGYVPDLRTVFAASAISVAPLRFSAGTQNKVIESMAAGLPVVTTSSVSAGLGTEPERDLLLADSAPTFSRQVIRLVRDEQLRRRLGSAGRAFAQTNFTSQPAIDRLHAIEDQTS